MEEERLYDIYALDEDIKILEETVYCLRNPKPFKYTNEQKAEAIEHLIEAYRKVKEEELHWKGQYHLLSRKIAVIPKSKIKEKIEQLKFVKNTPVKDNKYTYKECIEYGIEELQELLEEE